MERPPLGPDDEAQEEDILIDPRPREAQKTFSGPDPGHRTVRLPEMAHLASTPPL
jgi:hypothetical protein